MFSTYYTAVYNGLAMAMPAYQPDHIEDNLPEEPTVLSDPGKISGGNQPKNGFSFHVFFLVFWLTLIATVLLSWKMIVVQL